MTQTSLILDKSRVAKPFRADKPGFCSLCNRAIVKGDHVTWPRRGENRDKIHVHCGQACSCWDHCGSDCDCENRQAAPVLSSGNGHERHGNGLQSQPKAEIDSSSATAALGALAAVIEPIIASRVMNAEAIHDLVNEEINRALENFTPPEPPCQLIEVRTPIGEVRPVGRAHKQFKRLLALIAQRKDTYLYGSAGGGKSTAVRQCAEASGLEYSTISLNVQTTESKIAGYMDANGRYVEPLFRARYEKGGIYFVDETDNAAGNLLTSLNTALANGHHAFPDGMIARHPDFVCVGAGNTAGRGASRQHADRRQFDAAFSDRFFFMKWEYDEELERDAALAYGAAAEPWIGWVQRTRAYCAAQSLHNVSVTPRASIEGAKLIAAGFSIDRELADGLVFKGLEESQVNTILQNCPLPN